MLVKQCKYRKAKNQFSHSHVDLLSVQYVFLGATRCGEKLERDLTHESEAKKALREKGCKV